MQGSLKGLRCIGFGRVGIGQEHWTAMLAAQFAELKHFAESSGMQWVDQIEVHGQSADAELMIQSLLERRRVKADFDVLLASDLTRLSRNGAVHGFHLLREFEKNGVRIITPRDGERGDMHARSGS